MLFAATMLAALVLALAWAALLLARRVRAARAERDAAVGRAHARQELAAATADFEDTAGRLAATLAVHHANPSGGFGDGHVRRARLRAALATPAEQDDLA